MKIHAIYDKNDKFIIGFPTRQEAENYGKLVVGTDKGWEYDIREKFLHNTPQYSLATLTPQQTIPCTVSDVPYPFTIDYSQPPKAND